MSDRSRWLAAICLWVVSLATLTGTLLLLLWIELQTARAWAAEQVIDALRAGDQKMAAVWTADELWMGFPTDAVLNFAALSASVLLLAWLGRRWIAVALPFAVLVASLGPAYWDGGAITPHPIVTRDSNLWAWLVLEPAMQSTASLPLWPLLLGSVVQTLLALTPLLVAPRRLAQTRASAAIAAAVIPAVGLVIVAMVSMDNVTSSRLYRTMFGAAVLVLLSSLIVTGTGSRWVRVPAAILLPAALTGVLLPFGDGQVSHWHVAAVLLGCSFVVAWTLVLPTLRRRVRALTNGVAGTATATTG